MRKEFAKAATLRAISIASSMAAGLAAIKLNRMYLPDGVFALIMVASTIAIYLPFLDGGFRMVINQRLLASSDDAERRRLMRFGSSLYAYIYLLTLVAGTVLVAAFGLSSTGRTIGLSKGFYLTLGFTSGLTVIGAMVTQQLVGIGRQSLLYGIAIAASWLNLLTLWLGFHFGLGAWACPLSWVAVALLNIVVGAAAIRGGHPGIPFLTFKIAPGFRELWMEHRVQAFATVRLQLCSIVLLSMDTIAVFMLCSKTDADAYAVMARFLGIARNFMQTGGEVLWPLIAQKGGREVDRSHLLLRANGWIYGGVFGAMAVTLLPFCSAFLSDRGVLPDWVFWVTCLRGVVVGLATSATYPLFGIGRFDSVAKWLQVELILALALVYPMHYWLGLHGVAIGLLISTAGGTLFPLFLAYAKATDTTLKGLFFTGWSRVGIAALISGSAASFLLSLNKAKWMPAVAGVMGAGAAFGFAVLLANWRRTRHNAGHQTMKARVISVLSRI